MPAESKLPREDRAAGICHTPALAVPAGATRLRVDGDLSPDDLADPATLILGALSVSVDGGKNWQFVCALTFVGSSSHAAPFWVEATIPPAAAGTLVRASASLLNERGCRFGMKVSAG